MSYESDAEEASDGSEEHETSYGSKEHETEHELAAELEPGELVDSTIYFL